MQLYAEPNPGEDPADKAVKSEAGDTATASAAPAAWPHQNLQAASDLMLKIEQLQVGAAKSLPQERLPHHGILPTTVHRLLENQLLWLTFSLSKLAISCSAKARQLTNTFTVHARLLLLMSTAHGLSLSSPKSRSTSRTTDH